MAQFTQRQLRQTTPIQRQQVVQQQEQKRFEREQQIKQQAQQQQGQIVQEKQQEVSQMEKDYRQALKLFRKGERGENIVHLERAGVRRIFKDLKRGREAEVRAMIRDAEKQLETSLSPQSRQQLEQKIRESLQTSPLKSIDISEFAEQPKPTPTPSQEQLRTYQPPKETKFQKFFLGTKIEETPLSIFGEIKKDIVEGVRGTAPPLQKEFIETVREKGDIAVQKLEGARAKVEKFVTPPTAKDVILSKEEERITLQQEQLNKQVEDFNKQFTGELSETDFNLAQSQATRLEEQQRQLDFELSRIQSQQQAEKQLREQTPISFFGGAVTEAVTTPITLTSFGVKAVTRPITTTKETIEGIKGLPSQFVETPLSVTGSLVGSGVAFGVLGQLGAGGITRAGTIAKTFKVKPKASISVSLSDAVQTGANTWLVKSKVVTKLIHPKTRKVLDTITTEGRSYSVVATTEEGAVKSATQTVSASIGKYGQRVYKTQPKITQRYDLAKAEGTVNIKQLDLGKFEGTAETKIFDIGTFKVKRTPEELAGRVSFFKKQPQQRALTNIFGFKLGEFPTVRTIGEGIKVGGRQTFFGTKMLTGVTPEWLKVKGFKKGDKIIQPYLRRPRAEGKPPVKVEKVGDWDLTYGLGGSFTPEVIGVDLTKVFDIKPSKLKVPTPQAVSLIGAKAQVTAIAKAQAKKPKTVTKKVVSPIAENIAKAVEKGSVYTGAFLKSTKAKATQIGQVQITPPKLKDIQAQVFIVSPRERVASRALLGLEERAKTKEAFADFITPKETQQLREVQKTQQRQRTALRTALETVQQQKLRQIMITPSIVTPKPRTPKTPTTPKKIKIVKFDDDVPRKKREKELMGRDFYLAQIRRSGKWKPIAETRTFKKALKKGIFGLRETLGASLRILKKGKTPVPFVKSGREFRGAKRKPRTILVQRRAKRLGTFGERREIQRARRKIKW